MDILLMIKTILLGIVEGITEWLPISSTGHLILADEFIKLNMSDAFMEMFNVVIQLGAIMAVVVLYFHKLNPFSPKKNRREKGDTIILWTKVILAVLPAAVIGIPLDDWLDEHFYNPPVVAAMLIIYGILFIVVENRNRRSRRRPMDDLDRLSYPMALAIGAASLLFIVPGVILSLHWAFARQILCDNPEMDIFDALRLSGQMTKGHKGELFVLWLSFLGWFLLGSITLGLA